MGAGARGIALLEWMVIFTVICGIVLLLRWWSATLQKRNMYADDWMVLIAYVSETLIVYHHIGIPNLKQPWN